MPLCPQITITPITVTSSGMTQSSVIAAGAPATTEQLSTVSTDATAALAAAAAATTAAAAAIVTANAAQSTAGTALTNAATAYTAAIGSLQPSANTIVNASNQITAISSNGITVYSGASATSGARVVMNSAGLAGYDSLNVATFSITASSGAAVFSGSVTGATITGGTLNIGGNAIINSSGYLTAVGVTLTGNITATSGTFTGTVYASAGSFTGAVTATSGSFTGSVFASSGTIGGSTLSGSTITGGTIQTSSGAAAVILDGSSNAVTFKTSSTVVGHIVPLSSYGILTHYGTTADPTGGTFPQVYVGSSNVSLFANTSNGIGVSTSTGISLIGATNADDTISVGTYSSSSTSSTSGTYMSSTGPVIARRDNLIPFFAHRFNTSGTSEMIRLNYNGSDSGGITTTSGGVPAFRNASDYRLKQNIQNFDSAASLVKRIQLHSFEFIKDPTEPQIGFIAHELAEVLPALVMGEKDAIDQDGNPAYQSILATNLIPYLTGALKEAIIRIEALEGA